MGAELDGIKDTEARDEYEEGRTLVSEYANRKQSTPKGLDARQGMRSSSRKRITEFPPQNASSVKKESQRERWSWSREVVLGIASGGVDHNACRLGTLSGDNSRRHPLLGMSPACHKR